jgi:hypothetical protein
MFEASISTPPPHRANCYTAETTWRQQSKGKEVTEENLGVPLFLTGEPEVARETVEGFLSVPGRRGPSA